MAYPANHIWDFTIKDAPHQLLALTDTPPDPNNDSHILIAPANLDASITARLPPITTSALLQYIDIYVNDFISIVQGDPADQCRVRNLFFHTINKVFRPNVPGESIGKEPKSLNKHHNGDVAWTS